MRQVAPGATKVRGRARGRLSAAGLRQLLVAALTTDSYRAKRAHSMRAVAGLAVGSPGRGGVCRGRAMLAGEILLEDALGSVGFALGGAVMTSAAQLDNLERARDAVRFNTTGRFAMADAYAVAGVTGKALPGVRVRQEILCHFGVTVAA